MNQNDYKRALSGDKDLNHAWGNYTWKDCPMHAAHGLSRPTGPEMACWVALYDAGMLDPPAS